MNEKNMKEVGETLKKLRTDRNETIAQVADAVGVSAMAISYYEAGDRRPSDRMKIRLSDHFGVPVTIFYPSK